MANQGFGAVSVGALSFDASASSSSSNIFGQAPGPKPMGAGGLFGLNPMSTSTTEVSNPASACSLTPGQLQRFTPAFKLVKKAQSLESPAAIWSADLSGNCLFTGMGDGSVRVQEKTTAEKFTWAAHDKRVTCVRRHASSGNVMTSGAEGCFKVWTLMKDEVSSLTSNKAFELSLHTEIRKFLIVNDQWVFFATGRGLYRIPVATIDSSKPEKLGGNAASNGAGGAQNQNNDMSMGGSSSSTTQGVSSGSSTVPVTDIIQWDAQGDTYVIAAYKDGSIRVFHANSGEVKFSVQPMPDLKAALRMDLMNADSQSGQGRLICAHMDGKLSSFELPTFKRKTVWQAFEKSHSSAVVAVPSQIAARIGIDIRGLFITTSGAGALQLWQYVPEGGDVDDDL